MRLTPHFSLEELIFSDTAIRLGIDNYPQPALIDTLQFTALKMENVRELLGGKPIPVTSGYRCPELNSAVGGATNSQHMAGEAVDFTCKAFGTPAEIVDRLERANLTFDMLIEEYGSWVHISFVRSGTVRRRVLRFSK